MRNSDGEAVDPTRLSACRALTDDIVDRQEFQITSPTGRRYNFDAAGLPLIVDGNVTGAVSVWHDITEHKRKDEQNSILLRELAHRSKNLLSVIGSILRQSVKSTGSSEDLVARFSERLHALSNSQDLLARNNSLSVSMTDLIFSQVGHHWEPGQQRISMNGLGVRLRHDAAQMIGMALHELSTNAAKYGALSNQTGRVAIEWKIDHDVEPEPMFQLQWVERGGPPVIVPRTQRLRHDHHSKGRRPIAQRTRDARLFAGGSRVGAARAAVLSCGQCPSGSFARRAHEISGARKAGAPLVGPAWRRAPAPLDGF